MSTKTKKNNVGVTEDQQEKIRLAAYYQWKKSTDGNPVDEETTRQFWLEAEKKVVKEN